MVDKQDISDLIRRADRTVASAKNYFNRSVQQNYYQDNYDHDNSASRTEAMAVSPWSLRPASTMAHTDYTKEYRNE